MTDNHSVNVVGLRIEHTDGNPIGVGTARPRLSWRSETEIRGWRQAAWAVEVVDGDEQALWSSGRQRGDSSVLVAWAGTPLTSRSRCQWRVRVWGEDGSASDWSDTARFEVGLLESEAWQAQMISGPVVTDDDSERRPQPATHMRASFDLEKEIASARLHITACGVYEASINGRRVGDHVLAPGWTAYKDRMHVQSFDVTDLLAAGTNVIEAVVADGWFCGNLGFAGNWDVYGDRTGLLAQLEIGMADGTSRIVNTDETWEAATGPVLSADLYDGERYDARIEPGPWRPIERLPFDMKVLVPQASPAVRVTEIVAPIAIASSPSGRTIIDFGQNLVGVVRFRVEGARGTTITVRHAEVLEDRELCTRILRDAKATDQYTLSGTGVEEWHPRFTFHGFRYAEVAGWPGELKIDDVDALVLHTDMRRTGWLACSDDRLNRLHRNIVWGWRGNTVSLPTDCPQRDERLGWTGDVQVFAPTASFLYDTAGFLGSWLEDLVAEQLPDGRVPSVVPDILGEAGLYAAGWGDAATVVPSVLHEHYGDIDLLRRQLPSMAAWVQSIDGRAGDDHLWSGEPQYGDWVDPTVDPTTPGAARTDSDFVATAYFARSADLVSRAAEATGDDALASHYRSLADEIRAAIRHQWVAPSGRVVADTQTGCALALVFGLVEERHREVVGARLRQLVRNEQYRVATGFLGTPVLLLALSAAGYLTDAYRVLQGSEAPSWLYAVDNGATTIWERWDALRPDGRLNAGEGMLSFNHYALGAVGAWMHQTIGGLESMEPGFRRFRVAPRPTRGITSGNLEYDCPYGRIAIEWSLAGRGIDLQVEVPPNTTAQIDLPAQTGDPIDVGSGHHHFRYGIDDATYQKWVPPYSVNTAIRDLASDPDAWAVIEQHLPDVAARVDITSARSMMAAIGSGLPGEVILAVGAGLHALSTTPDPPAEIWPVGVGVRP
jgi:alpha-L-rhamnosidase